MAKIHLLEIATVFRRQGLLEKFREQEPLLIWQQVVGPHMSKLTSPLRVREGVLYIQVKNAVVAQQLELLSDKYLEKLNEQLETGPVKALRFRVGKIDVPLSQIEHSPEAVEIEDEELNEALGEITDPELKKSMEALMRYQLTLNKRREETGLKSCSICNVFHEESGEICYYCKSERGRG